MRNYNSEYIRKKWNMSRFTLLELMLVVSIIMILSSLLLPVLSQIKNVSRQSSCGNNMRQITFAAISYAGDNSDIIVPADWSTATTYQNIWTHRIIDYLNIDSSYYLYYASQKNVPGYNYRWRYNGDKLLYCPSLDSNPNDPPSNRNYSLTSYAINLRVAKDARLYPDAPLYRLSMIKNPTVKVFFTEYDSVYYSRDSISPGGVSVDWGIHSKLKANFSFIDGHVNAFSLGTLNYYNNWTN